jgi:aryl-alcohol dehydrogenase-like predicted oxidoreductase
LPAPTRPCRRPTTTRPTTRGARLAVLGEVAAELGATPNQVVLAWLMGGQRPIIPVVGTSTVAQLDELLGVVELPWTTTSAGT